MLRERERVHVAAQRNGASALTTLDAANDAGPRDPAMRNTVHVELPLDQLRGRLFLETEFRAPMNRAPQLNGSSNQCIVYLDRHELALIAPVRGFPPPKQVAFMMTPDLALALLINRTSAYYDAHPPQYITYAEHTHVRALGIGRTQDIDRSVAVRVADNYAAMKDLPNGEERLGQAFPIIPYFDPISAFGFSYFANLKRVDITLQRGAPITLAIPQDDPSVNVVVPYNSYWAARYAPDSTAAALHLIVVPTPRVKDGFYPPN